MASRLADRSASLSPTVWGKEGDKAAQYDDEGRERFTFADANVSGSGLLFVFGRYEPQPKNRKCGVQTYVPRWEENSRIVSRLERE